MDNVTYQKTLFKIVMCVMACDGEIHQSEIEEIELAFKQTDFFNELKFEEEMASVIEALEEDGKKFLWDSVTLLSDNDLTAVQELQVLELMLRIIYADGRVDKNEITFLKIVKARLSVSDEIFHKRFGKIEGIGRALPEDKVLSTTKEFVENINFPDISEMTNIEINK